MFSKKFRNTVSCHLGESRNPVFKVPTIFIGVTPAFYGIIKKGRARKGKGIEI
jgi:hypothetical protein